MSKLEKALVLLAGKPADFTWPELVALMTSLGIELLVSSGSARKFRNPTTGQQFAIHQPHPSNILKGYQIRDTIDFLKSEGFLK